ncbi:MAG TPA: hypothetical protein VK253_05715 [Candidatus Binatia bacterium]|nr:hypothetical protein [Candidatus Binatia bacterium]
MKALIALTTVSLIVSLSIVVLPVNALEPLNLTIKPDGSIEPDTDIIWLQRNESTYTFVVDFFGTITVQRAGITIDGAGHTLQGNFKSSGLGGINLVGHDETFNAYGNVLVKNLRIIDFFEGIRTPSNNNSFIGNRFENTRIHILGGPAGNVVKNNYFINSSVFVDYNYGGHDVITENNFFNSDTLVDLADAPFEDRNYWSNYTIKYPNATKVEGLGIWNTPYVDDRYSWATGRSIDYHPLVNPITDFEIPNFGIPAMPTLTPYPTINTGPEPLQTEPFLTTLVIVIGVSVAVAGVGLLVYLNKRKSKVR